MKKSLLLFATMFGIFAVPATVSAEDTPLYKQMEAMSSAYKGIRREQDPAKGATLAREAQEATLKSLMELPQLVKSIPDPDAKAKATVAYRKMLGQLFVTFCEVEEAFMANDLPKVAELYESLRDMRKSGHDQFMEEE